MSEQALQETNQEIHIKRLKVETINDKPFTLLSGSPVTLNLQAVLTDGNDATSMSIKNLQNLDVVNLDVININSTPFKALPTFSDVLSNGIDAQDQNIANLNNLDVLTINNTLYNGFPTITNILSNGHDASSLSISNLNDLQAKTIAISGNLSASTFNGFKLPSIQSGTSSPSSSYPLTITFLPAFEANPTVIAQPLIPSDYPVDRSYAALISNVTKNSFTIRAVYSSSGSSLNIPVMWQAML